MPSRRGFGPKQVSDPSVSKPCPACSKPFAAGDWTTLVTLGPGADEEARERHLSGRAYNAVAIEVHFGCVYGEEPAEAQAGEPG